MYATAPLNETVRSSGVDPTYGDEEFVPPPEGGVSSISKHSPVNLLHKPVQSAQRSIGSGSIGSGSIGPMGGLVSTQSPVSGSIKQGSSISIGGLAINLLDDFDCKL